jgi:hypothetical protein
LSKGVKHTRFSRSYNDYLNEIGVFSNREDDLAQLDAALAQRFDSYTIRTRGTVGLFSAIVGDGQVR